MSSQIVYWTPLAIESLEEVKEFILEEWNKKILEYFLQLTDKRIEQIMFK